MNKPRTRSRRSTTLDGDQYEQDDQIFYMIAAYGRTFHLNVTRNNYLVSANFVVEHWGENGTVTSRRGLRRHAGCHYVGTIRDHEHSSVAISNCRGLCARQCVTSTSGIASCTRDIVSSMRIIACGTRVSASGTRVSASGTRVSASGTRQGVFSTGREEFVVEPVRNGTDRPPPAGHPHLVYRRSALRHRGDDPPCGVQVSVCPQTECLPVLPSWLQLQFLLMSHAGTLLFGLAMICRAGWDKNISLLINTCSASMGGMLELTGDLEGFQL
uniref:Peptidase M12B propeptide domain-containing protein n=1 Tax=Branchiostoma floridae TaxID=7739 RepID=C3ZJ77_BRAFL|eukprot:XP_002591397.1 hypothetical protein BRAFLDRAFT_86915 [Branchiostoma floridae]